MILTTVLHSWFVGLASERYAMSSMFRYDGLYRPPLNLGVLNGSNTGTRMVWYVLPEAISSVVLPAVLEAWAFPKKDYCFRTVSACSGRVSCPTAYNILAHIVTVLLSAFPQPFSLNIFCSVVHKIIYMTR